MMHAHPRHRALSSGLRRFVAALALGGLVAGGLVAAQTTASAATADVASAVRSSVASAAQHGVDQRIAVIDRTNGKLLASSGGTDQVASASIVKLFTAAYYITKDGPQSVTASMMAYMIKYSDDATENAYWDCQIVDWARSHYHLTSRTANSDYSCGGWWGTVHLTANDMALFLWNVSHDSTVWPVLSSAMLSAADNGSDGFDQNFGFNAIAGTGSKQGWTDIAISPFDTSLLGLHSVGFTSRYFAAILQTGTSYSTMRSTATSAARAIDAAPPSAPAVPKPVVSFTAMPGTAAPGTRITLSGSLKVGSSGKANSLVDIWAIQYGTATWHRLTIARTDSSGNWRATITAPSISTNYDARYASPGYSSVSVSRTFQPAPVVSLTSAPALAAPGGQITVSGTLKVGTHGKANAAIAVYAIKYGTLTWTRVSTVTTDRNGFWKASLKSPTGTTSYQARYGQPGYSSASATKTVKPGPAVTMSAPTTTKPGSHVTLTGTLRQGSTAVKNAAVSVWSIKYGTVSWGQVGVAHTDSSGKWSLVVTAASVKANYNARYAIPGYATASPSKTITPK